MQHVYHDTMQRRQHGMIIMHYNQVHVVRVLSLLVLKHSILIVFVMLTSPVTGEYSISRPERECPGARAGEANRICRERKAIRGPRPPSTKAKTTKKNKKKTITRTTKTTKAATNNNTCRNQKT